MMDETGILIHATDVHGYITKCESTVALPNTARKFAVGCELLGNDGKNYTNSGTVASPSWQDENSIATGEIATSAVTLAKLASGITPSHIVKFFKLGSTITTTTLTGLTVDDIVISIIGDGTVTVATCSVANTLPADPADTTYLLVLRAVA